MTLTEKAGLTNSASKALAGLDSEQKNNALRNIADKIDNQRHSIIEANQKDIEKAEQEQLSHPLLKRLRFDNKKIDQVIKGIESLIQIPDPLGKTLSATELDEGLELYKVTCPIGVIGVIFESRPDALVQISTLCLKSGNGVLLKGGSEAANTNKKLTGLIAEATKDAGIPENWIQLMETRADVHEMLKLDEFIDLIIPRGSNEFVRHIMDHSNIPVLGHADGICHVYVDKESGLEMALNITEDSKIQYVAVCNALETLLVHKDVAETFLPAFQKRMEQHQVALTGCDRTRKIINISPAGETDWKTEYLDYQLSIKMVDSPEEAIAHINTYGSGHTDSIVTSNSDTASSFMDLVDSGNVLWNCSTRFSDGYRYGLGAEVGISTNKIHARGPVGMEGLLIYKWKLVGNGQIVKDYAENKRSFTHRRLNKDFKQ